MEQTINFADYTDLLERIEQHTCAIGDYSDLWKVKRRDGKPPQGVLAVKALRAASSTDPKFPENLRKALVELGDTWGQLKHRNIAPLLGVTYDLGRLPGIVLYFYESSVSASLAKDDVPDAEKLKWVKQIASGVKYLHTRSPPAVHGDIRCSNIFLDGEGQCVISDYGLANITSSIEFTSMKSSAACRWMAPEVMDPSISDPNPKPKKSKSGPEFTKQSDIFSFAMTMIEIFSGKVPFADMANDSSVIFQILNDERPPLPEYVRANAALSSLVKACWNRDAKSRPTISDVCWKLGLTSYFSYFLERLGII